MLLVCSSSLLMSPSMCSAMRNGMRDQLLSSALVFFATNTPVKKNTWVIAIRNTAQSQPVAKET